MLLWPACAANIAAQTLPKEEQSTASNAEASAEQLPGEQDDSGFWSQFIDPEDNNLDLSNWLIQNAYGFLPVPIIITEPAVDNGLGLAAVFFHKPDEDDPAPEEGKFLLPDVTAAVAAYTGNDSKIVGGGHFNTWRQDTRRYFGAIGYADVNLDFFGSAGSETVGSDDIPQTGAPFNAKGLFVDQELKFRLWSM